MADSQQSRFYTSVNGTDPREFYQLAFEQAPIGMALLDAAGKFQTVNNKLLKMMGYNREEMLALTWKEITHPNDLEEGKKLTELTWENKQLEFQVEKRYLRKDKTYFWALTTVNVLRDPEHAPLFYIAHILDISEKKNALTNFNTFFDLSLDLLTIAGSDGFFKVINPSFCKTLGYSKEELLAKPFLDLVHPDDLESTKKEMQKLDQGCKTVGFDNRYRHRDGHYVWLSWTSETVPERSLYYAVARDITGQKKFEKELKETNQNLQDLASHIETVREEEKAKFAQEIHDELGQILTATKLEIALLRKKNCDDNLSEIIDQAHQHLITSIEAVNSIATQLRPRILDSMGLIPALEWICDDTLKSTEMVYEIHDETQGYKIANDLAIIVFRICQETLTNALRHSKASLFEINLKVLEGKASQLLLNVRDDGVGYQKELVDLPSSHGLLGIQERVMSWGGKLSICSSENEGTIFNIELPLKRP